MMIATSSILRSFWCHRRDTLWIFFCFYFVFTTLFLFLDACLPGNSYIYGRCVCVYGPCVIVVNISLLWKTGGKKERTCGDVTSTSDYPFLGRILILHHINPIPSIIISTFMTLPGPPAQRKSRPLNTDPHAPHVTHIDAS